MSDKIARLGIERDNDLMYYIKDGAVWATPRKQKGQPKGQPRKIADTGLKLDYSNFIYFVDGDGDVARNERAVGGRSKSKSTKVKSTKVKAKKTLGGGTKASPTAIRSSISGHYVTEATAKRHPKTTVAETLTSRRKSPEQLDREIDECLAQAEPFPAIETSPAGAAKKTKKTWW